MSRYSRIQSKIWHDEKFRSLSDDGKLMYLSILTSPHGNMLGYFVLPKPYLMHDLGWGHERVNQTLSELLDNGLIKRCKRSDVVLLPNFLKYNPIQNKNQAKGARKRLSELPENTLSQDFLSVLKENSEYNETVSKGLPKGFETPPNTETETEAVTETETEAETEGETENDEAAAEDSGLEDQESESQNEESDDEPPPEHPTPAEFKDYWNEIAANRDLQYADDGSNWLGIVDMTDKRRTKLRTRRKNEWFRDNWRLIVRKALASEFLVNSSPYGIGDRSFFGANWVIKNDENPMKILEGDYDDGGTNQQSGDGGDNHRTDEKAREIGSRALEELGGSDAA